SATYATLPVHTSCLLSSSASAALLCSPSLFSLQCSAPRRALHSFPTRRSSDLVAMQHPGREARGVALAFDAHPRHSDLRECAERSEEHTSELQSHLNLVCRLLLEKKNKKNKEQTIYRVKKTQKHTSTTPLLRLR